jgi:hypothetical protein
MRRISRPVQPPIEELTAQVADELGAVPGVS